MQELIASGRIVDLILGLVLLEALALAGYRRLTGQGMPVADVVANLLAGVCLLLALRAALTGLPWPGVAAALAASLLAHVLDLSRRWPRRAGSAKSSHGNIAAKRVERTYDGV